MVETINRLSLYFSGQKCVEAREETLPLINSHQVLVQTLYSAISPGTELLIYRQQISIKNQRDINIRSLSGNFEYPFKYGYSIVGKVISSGPGIDPSWNGKTVFAFHPHESLFPAYPDELLEVPEGMSPLDAVFLANMETAVNLVMDGHPLLGEKVVVLGQGIVGLLTTSILSQFPLSNLITADLYPLRRRISQQMGARISLDPGDKDFIPRIQSFLRDTDSSAADLTFEVSGNPKALNGAIELTGFGGRIIVGSWYGSKPVNLKLDESFHRSRIRLVSSQVSTISPDFLGRWNKHRRFQTAWSLLDKVRPSRFISRYFPLTEATEAYKILEEKPDEVIQIIFTYPEAQEDCV